MDFSISSWVCYSPDRLMVGVHVGKDNESPETYLPGKNIISVGKNSDFQIGVICHFAF